MATNREQHKAWRDRNPERCKEYAQRSRAKLPPNYMKEWRERNKDAVQEKARLSGDRYLWQKLNGARQRARRLGLPFDLTIADIVIPEVCPIFGTPLQIRAEDRNNSPALDRVDNSKGYVRGNVCVISSRANMAKRDLTIEEVRKLLAYMEHHAAIEALMG